MALQNWTEISATIYGNPKLSQKARMISAKLTKLGDLVDPSEDFYLGKKSGESVGYRLVGRISGTADTALGEFTPVPFSKPPVYHGTGTVYRYAKACAWTGEEEDLDRLDVEDTTIRALSEHAARTINKLIYTALVAGRSFTYAPTGAAEGTFSATGAIATEAADELTLWHLQNITRYGLKQNIPYADGENYITALSPTAYFNILMDTASGGFVDVKKYGSGGVEGVLKNEVGKVANHRIIVDNDVLDDGIGASDAFGSGFVCGYEAIKELMVYPTHFRYNGNLGGDFGNQKGIAWQALLGYSVPWSFATHGQGSILHYTST